MRTQVLAECRARFPWLAPATPNSALAAQIDLDRFPFTIGRNESCDLTIPSTRVSRDHATITGQNFRYQVEDGGSTNGTFVNGTRIEGCVDLADGDIIRIADIEFTFHSGRSGPQRATVTQPLAAQETSPADNEAQRLVHALRSRQEGLLHRAIRLRFQPVVELPHGQAIGYEVIRKPCLQAGGDHSQDRLLVSTECRIVEHEQALVRMLAVEQVRTLPGCSRVWLSLETSEIGADDLPLAFRALQDQLGAGRHIVAAVPDSVVADIAYFRNFIARLRSLSICISFEGFAGGASQLQSFAPFAPDFVKLAPALIRGIDRSTDRQSQVQSIVQAAKTMNIAAIANGVHTEGELEVCRRLGCKYAQGDHLGLAQTIDWPLLAKSSPA